MLALLISVACSPALAQAHEPPGGLPLAGAPATTAARRQAPALPQVTSRAVRDGLLATAESYRKQQAWIEALRIYQHLLSADPRDDVAYRMRALTLTDLGASFRAAELLRASPHDFADFQRDRIEGDEVARAIGWGMTYPQSEEDRDAEMLHALAAVKALQTRGNRTRWEQTRLRMDSLVALNSLRRYEETVAEYKALLRENADLPAYVHGPAGDALLALRRPAEAEVALKKALALKPGDVDTRILLAYAYLEQERFDLALPLVEQLVQSQPAWPRRIGAKAGYENWDRYQADITRALMISLGHDHVRAQSILDGLARTGPRHAGTQAALGVVLNRRMQPTAALERYDMALTLDPRNRDAALGRVTALLDLQRVDEALEAHRAARTRFPDDLHVRRLGREVTLRLGPQGRIGWTTGRNDPERAGSSPFGLRDRRLGVEAWTPLLGQRWRLGVLGDEVSARFQPDTVRFRRTGIGADYRHDRLGLRAAVYGAAGTPRDTAWTLDGEWRLDDAWSLRAGLAGNDIDTSLQARRSGLHADSAMIAAAWTPNDLAAVDAQVKRLRYSDGNVRDQASVFARRRLYSAPHLLIDALASGWSSRASSAARPYFNPSHDAMTTLGIRFDHIIWRRYERHLRQRLDLQAGPYWQQGYGAHWVPSIAYWQEWRPAQGHTFDYGVSWSRPVYDGARERRIAFEASYRWGF